MPGVSVEFDFWEFLAGFGIEPWMIVAALVGIVLIGSLIAAIISKLGKTGGILLLIAAGAVVVLFVLPKLNGVVIPEGDAHNTEKSTVADDSPRWDEPNPQPVVQPSTAVALLDRIITLFILFVVVSVLGVTGYVYLKFRAHRAGNGSVLDLILGKRPVNTPVYPHQVPAHPSQMLNQLLTLEFLRTLRDIRTPLRSAKPYQYIDDGLTDVYDLPWWDDEDVEYEH